MFLDDKPQGEVTEAPAKTLKLSEAIRIGASLRGQCFQQWYEQGRSCALGAAAEAIFGECKLDGDGLVRYFPELETVFLPSPVGINRSLADGEESDKLIDHIVLLNDEMEWKREAIADWLEAVGY